jgi:drug/metabolite transporter (DMT)-like permease
MSSTGALNKKGVWYSVSSGLLYGLLGYFGISLMRTGLSIPNFSFWRFFASLMFLLILMVMKKHKVMGPPKQLMLAFFNGAIFYSAPAVFFFMASQLIGTGQAMVIFFTYPAFVMVLNWWFLGQRILPYYFVSFAIIFSGLSMLVDVGEVSFDILGIGYSLMAALAYGAYVFLSKKIQLSPLSSTFMVSLGCTVAFLAWTVGEGSFMVPTSERQWIFVAGIGILCSAVPIILMLEALKYITADKASILSVSEPVSTVILGVVLLDEIIRINTVIGIVLTLVGAMSITINWGKLFKR